jgi:NADH-ubiquinone oxidoreductase chain 6
MNSIYLIKETYTNGYIGEFLDIISLISIIFGIFIIISKNPIVSVLFLIFLFSSVSIYLIMLGITFIGISYLLVYVGAVSILFIFILMLINIRISELLSDTSNSIPLGIFITISFYYPIVKIMSYNTTEALRINITDLYIGPWLSFYKDNPYIINQIIKGPTEVPSFTTSKNWDGTLAETTHITSLGNIMYSSYAIWLIITSIILLLAMVGAIVITIK